MSNRRILTRTTDGRWRKIFNGKAKYFGKVDPRRVGQSYRDAERRYLEFRANHERLRPVDVPVSTLTIGDFGEKFLQHEYRRYERREISASRFERIRATTSDFVGFNEEAKPMDMLNELTLDDYRSHTLGQPVSPATGKPISLWTAKSRLDVIKSMIRWGYRLALLNRLPRNLDRYSRVNLPPPVVQVFVDGELARLFAADDDRMRAWMLLGLNCGYGQSDIAELRVKDFDFNTGHICRVRTKTGIESRHLLWPETIQAIRSVGRFHGNPTDRIFVSTRGRPLVHEAIIDDRLKKTDAIRSAFNRLKNTAGIKGRRGFYTLRKTAASEIERIDPAVTELFLAHTERGLKRHYALRDWDRLDVAVETLRTKLGIDQLVDGLAPPTAE